MTRETVLKVAELLSSNDEAKKIFDEIVRSAPRNAEQSYFDACLEALVAAFN